MAHIMYTYQLPGQALLTVSACARFLCLVDKRLMNDILVFLQPSMPVATLPQAVQTAAKGTHRMSKGDRKVHPAGLVEPRPKPACLSQREQCQSYALTRRVRGQRVLQEQWVRMIYI